MKLAVFFEVKVMCSACKGTGQVEGGYACGTCEKDGRHVIVAGRAVEIGTGLRPLLVDSVELWWLSVGGYVEQDGGRVCVCPPRGVTKSEERLRESQGPKWRSPWERPPPREGVT